MSSSDLLNQAKKNKRDEFYTQMSDIEAELRHYRPHFKNKIVLCNCDDPYESNFFKYFALNFNFLGLKKLLAVSYTGSPVAGTQFSLFDDPTNQPDAPYKVEITQVTDHNQDDAFDLEDVQILLKQNTTSQLKGDGDFRSAESIELLKQADIVVTNPPFSLFREYIAQLIEYKKNFIVLGNHNSITYKDIFGLIESGLLWLGNDNGGTKWFHVPDDYDNFVTESRIKFENGKKYFSFGNVGWFTNLDFKNRHDLLTLFKKYTPEEYPGYDSYPAIEVSKVAEIPYDYSGIMGVPITFLNKYNPDQFSIVGLDRYVEDNPNYGKRFTLHGRETYARILIKHKGSVAK